MSSQDDDQDIRVAATVLISVILLVIGLAVGIGIHKSRDGSGVGAPVTAATPLETPAPATEMATDGASVVVEAGVVKFFFASGKAELAAGALDALKEAITAAQAGRTLVISGFHDATGDPAMNAELARQRAVAVRDALLGAGVAMSSLQLKKPEQTTGDGSHAQARRVEVVIAE